MFFGELVVNTDIMIITDLSTQQKKLYFFLFVIEILQITWYNFYEHNNLLKNNPLFVNNDQNFVKKLKNCKKFQVFLRIVIYNHIVFVKNWLSKACNIL